MILQVEQLGFGYGRRVPLLRDINFGVDAGQVCCLLGPNGAGKTSLIRCLVGIGHPSHGGVRIDGRDVSQTAARELARSIAYVPQSTETAFAFSVADVVTAGRTAYVRFGGTPSAADRRLALEALEWVGIRSLADRLFNRISGGERQLALIARALAQATPVLVLDEPTSALDYGNQVRVLQIVADLARLGKAILMSSHAPWQAFDYAHSVLLLKRGRVFGWGASGDVLDSDLLSDL